MAMPGHLIFQDKRVEGFWLSKWMTQKNILESLVLWRRSQKMLASVLKSEIRARVPLEGAIQAIQAYERRMTGGKVLITPNGN
jgi:hypothetical protein